MMIQRLTAFKTMSMVALLTLNYSLVKADTSALDVKVGAKAAGFVQPSLNGDIPTAILYDPANPESKADAETIAKAFGSGLKISGGLLRPTLVPVGEAGDLSGMKVVFVANGIGTAMASMAQATSANGILTISSDMDCVDQGLCVVGVETKPKVSIVVSKSGAADANLQFGAAFLMMVKER